MNSSLRKANPSQRDPEDRQIGAFVVLAAISFGLFAVILFYFGFGVPLSIGIAAFLGLLVGSLAAVGLTDAELIEWALADRKARTRTPPGLVDAATTVIDAVTGTHVGVAASLAKPVAKILVDEWTPIDKQLIQLDLKKPGNDKDAADGKRQPN